MDLEDDMLDLKSKLKKSEREKIMLENEKVDFEENFCVLNLKRWIEELA